MKTFWNSDHDLNDLATKLEDLVPAMGEVADPRKNPALEKFRKASNAYYDIFNNGGCNRAREIGRYFGRKVNDYLRTYWSQQQFGGTYKPWHSIHEIVEPKMAEIVEAAAKEQGVTVDSPPPNHSFELRVEVHNENGSNVGFTDHTLDRAGYEALVDRLDGEDEFVDLVKNLLIVLR